MSLTVEQVKARNQDLIKEVLEVYPDKTAKRRAKHLGTFEEGKPDCGVKSNVKSIPGVMTIRGCAYAGSKGVVWGPIKDMIHISHGPVGCGQYSWAARRNYYIGTTGVDTSVTCSSPPTSRRRTSFSAATRSWKRSSTKSRNCSP